jgi:D-arabinose 1-dehydrogenase-like Zn-dependent alcohol dehydrogenase
MKAAVMEAFNEPLKIHSDWRDPECGPDDVVLKIMANGICRSDWHFWQGGFEWVGFVPPLPTVLGHEFCGMVEEVGANVAQYSKGDRVVTPFVHACGRCPSCASGFQNTCENMAVPAFNYDGGFGEYAQVAHADVNLVPLPESISFVDAASLGCRYITAFRGVVGQGGVQPGDWVAVFGCGGVGLAAVEIASAIGANVIAVSRTDEKLEMAKKLGAVHTVKAGETAPEAIVEHTKGGVHVAIDCLGTAATWMPAIMSLRVRGKIVRLGISSKEEQGQLPIPADVFVLRELTLVGSLGMQPHHYGDVLQMVEGGKLDPARLVTGTVGLEGVTDVLNSMSEFGTVGVSVVDFG